MNITYKKYGEREESESLTAMLDQSNSYYSGQLEQIHDKLYNHFRVTERLVDILYHKGLLNKDDIRTLISTLVYIDEDSEIKIEI